MLILAVRPNSPKRRTPWNLDCSNVSVIADGFAACAKRHSSERSTRGTRRNLHGLVGSYPSSSSSRVTHKSRSRALRIYNGSVVGCTHPAGADHCKSAGRNSLSGDFEVRRLSSAESNPVVRNLAVCLRSIVLLRPCRRHYAGRSTFRHNWHQRGLDISLHWCTLSVAGEFSLGRHSVKKILITILLAATPLVALASQDPQVTPDTGSKAANSHHARRHHKRSRNSHHAKHHRATKQHSQTQ